MSQKSAFCNRFFFIYIGQSHKEAQQLINLHISLVTLYRVIWLITVHNILNEHGDIQLRRLTDFTDCREYLEVKAKYLPERKLCKITKLIDTYGLKYIK